MWASGCEYCLATDSPLFSVIAAMVEGEEGTAREGKVAVVEGDVCAQVVVARR